LSIEFIGYICGIRGRQGVLQLLRVVPHQTGDWNLVSRIQMLHQRPFDVNAADRLVSGAAKFLAPGEAAFALRPP
jgi:hypothetical protein